MSKKTLNLAILVIGIGLIINLSKDILRLLKAGDRIKQAENKLQEAEEKAAELQEREEYYQSEEFIEEEARNKLNLSREKETVVILPPNVEELIGHQETEKAEPKPNWKQWWQLFF